jgi:hypothetical protein
MRQQQRIVTITIEETSDASSARNGGRMNAKQEFNGRNPEPRGDQDDARSRRVLADAV